MRRMRHFSSSNENEASIDMSPLIDVVFILLIFFIVTTVFNNEAGVDVAKPPKMASSKSLDSNAIIMAVTNNGQVYYAGRNIGINGVAGAVAIAQAGGNPLPLIIQGDYGAEHGIITKVIGAATEAGVKSVAISTKK
ncbi:MAG: biopolymer transport protein ExbD [Rubritalea sp.]|jgi:biopolymer transport protein ExbD